MASIENHFLSLYLLRLFVRMILDINGSQLYYSKQGDGNKALLLFHGFGQDHSAFQDIIERISSEYTCYTFDLFFHGSSLWNKGEQPLEKSEWNRIMELFLRESNLNEISLMGYSLGGKFVFATMEGFPEKVKEVFLIAPDGIKISFWYSLATYPILFRKIFKSLIAHPKRFISIANFSNLIGLLDKGVVRFAESQMNTWERRSRVYFSWVVFRHLNFDMRDIAAIINRHKSWLIIIVGKYDRVVKAKHMDRLLRHVDQYQMEILETGHNRLLGEETANLIINSPKSAL
ncbi:MAG TPA: alpha/beta hydrolase [Cyclobacteriaceae bacterium]|nr:alpha/beta hydrolase [Cyclobacteriaceae bacterium]